MSNKFFNRAQRDIQDIINNICVNKALFVKNPDVDFIRRSKLPLSELMKLILSMDGTSITKEMNNYFNFSVNVPSASALVQQRDKLKPDAFEFLFKEFTSRVKCLNKFKGYRLLACDGSSIRLPYNPNDSQTFRRQRGEPGYNALHLNALYDILNHIYVDADIQGEAHYNEYQAFVNMIDRANLSSKTIILCDRGYESYNNFAHVMEKGYKFLIRIRDHQTTSLLSGLNLKESEFDIHFSKILTRKQTKAVLNNPIYRFLPNHAIFDYLNSTKEYYPINFRLARFQLEDGSYECVATNLDEREFPSNMLKALYHLRWGIETSFRDLKYSIGLSHLHAKKTDSILQELYAKLTVYNFCQAIITRIHFQKKCKTYIYRINITNAMHICKHFFCKHAPGQTDIEALILRAILPVRPGRHDKRKSKTTQFVSFVYRVA